MSEETTIHDNLRYLLKLHDELTISELARQTQIPQPTLHHLLNGTTKRPRRRVLERLATFFSISIPQLTGLIPLNQSITDSIKRSLKLSTIPIINWGMVANWPEVDKTSKDLTQIILDRQVGADSFALVAKDSSMEPLFPENSILIFDPTKTPKDRDFIVVWILEKNKVLFNRLYMENQELFIKQDKASDNMNLIKLRPDIDRIIGTLIEVRLKF
jgi:SOS-response transcriptional repressor LexA